MRSLVTGAIGALLWYQSPIPDRLSDGRSVWDSVYTVEQAERGAVAYVQACARCHGPQLTGGEMAPPLVGMAFLANWNGTTVGDLYERIRVSMPGDNPGSLPGQLIVDVLAQVLRANGFPAGRAELPGLPAALKLIQIEARP